MNVLWEQDGCGLAVDDGVLWLFVRDGNGRHSTALTDETRHVLRALLMGNAADFAAQDRLVGILVGHGIREAHGFELRAPEDGGRGAVKGRQSE